jgi:hypothetical protein
MFGAPPQQADGTFGVMAAIRQAGIRGAPPAPAAWAQGLSKRKQREWLLDCFRRVALPQGA